MIAFARQGLYRAGLILSIFAVAGCAPSRHYQHPNLVDGKRQIGSIAILPPEVEYVRIVFSGENERLHDRERQIANELVSRIQGGLRAKGYQVVEVNETQQREDLPAESIDLQKLRSAYRQAMKQLAGTEETLLGPKATPGNVGPIANLVSDEMKADVLLLARYSGFEKSKGQKAQEMASTILFGALTGVIVSRSPTGGALELALIDGATGDILWTNRASTADQRRSVWHRASATNLAGSTLSSLPSVFAAHGGIGATGPGNSTAIPPAGSIEFDTPDSTVAPPPPTVQAKQQGLPPPAGSIEFDAPEPGFGNAPEDTIGKQPSSP